MNHPAVELEPAWQTVLDPGLPLGGAPELIANFNHFQRFSTPQTELAWAVLRRAGTIVAAAPVVRLRRRAVTDLLRDPWRKRLRFLGPLARKTTLLVDTAFQAYDNASPILTAPEENRVLAKLALANFLRKQKKIDTVWISEPPEEAAWAAGTFDQFHTLPMVVIDLRGAGDFQGYLAGLSKKRRRNYRHEADAFAAGKGTIEVVAEPPAGQRDLAGQLVACLRASEAHATLFAPYNDVLAGAEAFAEQPQTAIVARAAGQVVGFMSFLQVGRRWMQVHGGLDYGRSHEVFAYHNLIYAAVREALARGCEEVTMGPLNNETKRRAGSELRPIVASVWNRWPADRALARAFFFRNFGVYSGPLAAPHDV